MEYFLRAFKPRSFRVVVCYVDLWLKLAKSKFAQKKSLVRLHDHGCSLGRKTTQPKS